MILLKTYNYLYDIVKFVIAAHLYFHLNTDQPACIRVKVVYQIRNCLLCIKSVHYEGCFEQCPWVCVGVWKGRLMYSLPTNSS